MPTWFRVAIATYRFIPLATATSDFKNFLVNSEFEVPHAARKFKVLAEHNTKLNMHARGSVRHAFQRIQSMAEPNDLSSPYGLVAQ